MNVTRVNGVQLHYSAEGPTDKPVIVFSNSLGTDFRMWDRLVSRFDRRFRMVRYDKRGHGLSEATSRPYAMDDHVGDLIGLLDHLKLDRIILCGLSVGGLIAQGVAARQPERLSALILCDTAAKIGTPEMWGDRMAAIEKGGIEALADPIMERWLSADFRTNKPEESLAWRNMLTRTTLDGYLGTCAAIRDADLTESTRQLKLPVLGIVAYLLLGEVNIGRRRTERMRTVLARMPRVRDAPGADSPDLKPGVPERYRHLFRVGHSISGFEPIGGNCARLLADSNATIDAMVADIDAALRLGAHHPMGPLQLADFIGLDTCLSIMQVLHDGLADSKYRPCPLLVKYVEAGWLGRKTGRGFYDYAGETPVPTR